ncbi:uncharacterized protein LOC134008685 isoform X1 [Osmerus eperlanus]|uniref:uncharacterized protein LOC134008685 isoform X1 n=1 Tax=Osmerus eperlanus TaxID=29151 RepID=UPI002E10C15B
MRIEKFKSLYKMLIWVVGLMLVLMCSGNQAQETVVITMKNRVMVVVPRQEIKFEFTASVPANESFAPGFCRDPEEKTIYTFTLPTQRTKVVVQRGISIAFEKSGHYKCQFKESKVYFVVLVKEEAYRKPGHIPVTAIVLATLDSALLIFSVLGSIYTFKGHRCQLNTRNQRRHARNGERDNEQVQEEKRKKRGDSTQAERAETSASVYASLDPQTISVYEELHPEAANSDNQEKKVKKKSKQLDKLVEKKAQEGMDGDDECVYENF